MGSSIYRAVFQQMFGVAASPEWANLTPEQGDGGDHSKRIDYKKRADSNHRVHGVSNVFELPEIKQKIRATHLTKYGVSHPSQSPEVQDIRITNNLSKYGVDHPSKLAYSKQRTRDTNTLLAQRKIVGTLRFKKTEMRQLGLLTPGWYKKPTPYLENVLAKCLAIDGMDTANKNGVKPFS